MTVIACIALILSALILMIAFAIGPFANEPWLKIHNRFTLLSRLAQISLKALATVIIVFCSLQIIGVFA